MQVDFLGESTEGNLHLVRPAGEPEGAAKGIIDVLGLTQPEDVFSVPLASLRDSKQVLLWFMNDASPCLSFEEASNEGPDGQLQKALWMRF